VLLGAYRGVPDRSLIERALGLGMMWGLAHLAGTYMADPDAIHIRPVIVRHFLTRDWLAVLRVSIGKAIGGALWLGAGAAILLVILGPDRDFASISLLYAFYFATLVPIAAKKIHQLENVSWLYQLNVSLSDRIIGALSRRTHKPFVHVVDPSQISAGDAVPPVTRTGPTVNAADMRRLYEKYVQEDPRFEVASGAGGPLRHIEIHRIELNVPGFAADKLKDHLNPNGTLNVIVQGPFTPRAIIQAVKSEFPDVFQGKFAILVDGYGKWEDFTAPIPNQYALILSISYDPSGEAGPRWDAGKRGNESTPAGAPVTPVQSLEPSAPDHRNWPSYVPPTLESHAISDEMAVLQETDGIVHDVKNNFMNFSTPMNKIEWSKFTRDEEYRSRIRNWNIESDRMNKLLDESYEKGAIGRTQFLFDARLKLVEFSAGVKDLLSSHQFLPDSDTRIKIQKAQARLKQTIDIIDGFFAGKENQMLDVNALVWETVVERSNLYRTIIIQTYEARLPSIVASPLALGRAIANLLHNTGEAMKSKWADRRVWVSTRLDPDEQHVVLEVQDNGDGILEEDLPRIFEHAFTTKYTAPHLASLAHMHGKGLSVVLEAVRALNGSITVASKRGEGSVFTIRIPLPSAPATHDPDLSLRAA